MTKKRLLGVQVLRGVLAMMVYLQHVITTSSTVAMGPTDILFLPNFGGVGVMVFFALSGYVMAQKLDEKPGKFLIDRFRRVYPPLWIALALAGLATMIISGQTGLTWQLFFLIPAGSFPIVPMPYWTLYWEVIFYLLVTVTMFIGPRAFWGGLSAWAVAGLIGWHRPWGAHLAFPGWYDVLFNPFAVFFLSGALAFRLQGWFSSASIKSTLGLALVLLFALPMSISKGVVGNVLTPASSWPFLSLAVGAFFALVAAVHWTPARGRDALWVKMGNYSYGIYLIHVVPMILAAEVLRSAGITGSFWVAAAVMATVAFVPAVLMGMLDVALQKRLSGHRVTIGKPVEA